MYGPSCTSLCRKPCCFPSRRFLHANFAAHPYGSLGGVEQIDSLVCLPYVVEGMNGRVRLFFFQDAFVEIFKLIKPSSFSPNSLEIYSEQT